MREPMSEDLDRFIRQGWNDHADHPEAVAQRVAQRVAVEGAGPALAPLVGLLVHVYGEHLGRWAEGAAVLRELAARAPDEAAIPRGIAALGLAGGDPQAADGLAPDERIAALGTASTARLGHADPAGADRLLTEAVDTARGLALADASPAVRAIAVAANNLSAELQDRVSRTPAEDALMVTSAEQALAHWRRAGGWLEHERAEYMVARALLRAGRGADGLPHARQCLALCDAHQAPPFERFFGHTIAALCAHAAGEVEVFDEQFERALRQRAEVSMDDLHWCDKDLAELRAAAGDTHLGRCTCGEIRFRLTARPLVVHACHCRWCQRETGTAFALNAMIETDRVQRLSGTPELLDTPSASGRGQKIARCPRCRVAVWSHYPGSGPAVAFVRVGSLLDPDRLPPDIHIFTSTKQPWLRLPEGVPAVPEYYEREAHWPAESLARREALLKRAAAAAGQA